jgi:predicted MFS family arabinose efflux permease
MGASAISLAVWPTFPSVLTACAFYAGANCVLNPAIAAISLGLVGYQSMGERLARNARFSSMGGGLAAGAMGAIGYFISKQSVFLVTAALTIPAVIALLQISREEIDPLRARGASSNPVSSFGDVLTDPRLVTLAGAVLLFHVANAPMLLLLSGLLAKQLTNLATIAVGLAVIVSQLVIAAASPWVGRKAQSWGRRPLLLLSYGVLATHLCLLSAAHNPYAPILLQILDGLSAAIFATIIPLIAADVTRGTGHFNLALGVLGSALGIGASFGTTFAGYASDYLGRSATFLALAGVALLGLGILWLFLPETRVVRAAAL